MGFVEQNNQSIHIINIKHRMPVGRGLLRPDRPTGGRLFATLGPWSVSVLGYFSLNVNALMNRFHHGLLGSQTTSSSMSCICNVIRTWA